jgi:elongation factor G
MPKAGPVLLEPIMKLDVTCPGDKVGDVIGDINRRRGIIHNQEMTGTVVRVYAEAPIGEMFGYIGDLRSQTSGRGQFSMEFSHYAPCPNSIAEVITKKV